MAYKLGGSDGFVFTPYPLIFHVSFPFSFLCFSLFSIRSLSLCIAVSFLFFSETNSRGRFFSIKFLLVTVLLESVRLYKPTTHTLFTTQNRREVLGCEDLRERKKWREESQLGRLLPSLLSRLGPKTLLLHLGFSRLFSRLPSRPQRYCSIFPNWFYLFGAYFIVMFDSNSIRLCDRYPCI